MSRPTFVRSPHLPGARTSDPAAVRVQYQSCLQAGCYRERLGARPRPRLNSLVGRMTGVPVMGLWASRLACTCSASSCSASPISCAGDLATISRHRDHRSAQERWADQHGDENPRCKEAVLGPSWTGPGPGFLRVDCGRWRGRREGRNVLICRMERGRTLLPRSARAFERILRPELLAPRFDAGRRCFVPSHRRPAVGRQLRAATNPVLEAESAADRPPRQSLRSRCPDAGSSTVDAQLVVPP